MPLRKTYPSGRSAEHVFTSFRSPADDAMRGKGQACVDSRNRAAGDRAAEQDRHFATSHSRLPKVQLAHPSPDPLVWLM